ncbi:MAG: arginine--tRNA ligase [Verrucomicrobia bacterium]|nr:arginine--tRNA ligase [Verrucomicrobiota bacterium]
MLTPAAQLTAILRRALAALAPEPPSAEFIASAEVTAAADARFGDYQANAAMTLAKARRTNPRALATEIKARLDLDPELTAISAPVEIAGAGFLNFRLTSAFLATRLGALLADSERVGVEKTGSPQRVVIDFSSPNIAKPMHVGHLRSTILGDCLARIARFLGHEVITDNHLGDWGTQFGKVIYGWKNFLDEQALAVDALAELVRIYKLANDLTDEQKQSAFEEMAERYLAEHRVSEGSAFYSESEAKLRKYFSPVRKAAQKASIVASEGSREELAKLQTGDAENRAIWQRCVDLSRAELEKIYARLGIHFDLWLGESFYNDRLAPLIERLQKIGLAEPSEGALVIFFRDDPKLADKPSIVRKRDGAFNYTTTDIATLEYRVHELGATAIWAVVGAPQALHFEQLNAIGRRLGIAVPTTHIAFGSILGEDRKLMRTRSGDSVALRDLLDEAEERARRIIEEKNPAPSADEKAGIARVIGLGAVKYAELSQGRLTDYVFSWDRMLSFQGNTAPYLQNAFVRIQSIFRKLAEAPAPTVANDLHLADPAELALAKKLAQFAEAVPAVLDDFRPNTLANYLYELANDFHAFYEACPVLKSEGATRASRLALCRVTANVLQIGLALLGIEVPARM